MESLCQPLRDAVAEAFGFKQPTPIQAQCLAGMTTATQRDVLIKSKTGSGKTLAFLLPLLNDLLGQNAQGGMGEKRGQAGTLALIMVPTRELAVQTQQCLTSLLAKLRGKHHWLVSGALTGGDSRKSEKARLRKGLHLVVATPGRLLDHLESTASWRCTGQTLRWLVVDEADRLMDMGFQEKVGKIMVKLGERAYRLVLCSATVDAGLSSFAGLTLKDPLLLEATTVKTMVAEPSALPDTLIAYAVPPTKLRLVALIGQIKLWLSNQAAKLVIFTLCCDSVDYLHRLFTTHPELKQLGLNFVRLHGSLEQAERIASFKQFTQAKQPACLICTDVAARGLNLERITGILQWDAPCDLVDFLHRTGRTGRLGDQEGGQSTLLLQPSEREYVNLLGEKGVRLKPLKFDPLIAWLRNVKLAAQGKTAEKREGVKEEDEAEEVPASLRAHHAQWQQELENFIKSDRSLFDLAKLAYTSTLRAYATHPSSEKHIFHLKKLHLGHLAASFGLTQAPTNLKTNLNMVVKGGKTNDRPLKNKLPRTLTMSEFDAGDPFASDSNKRRKK